METNDVCEQLNTSTSMSLLDDVDILQVLPTVDNVADTIASIPSPSALQSAVCSPSYTPSNKNEPIGLTPDEAAELLKALDASETSQTPDQEAPVSGDIVAHLLPPKQEKKKRYTGRKKLTDPSTGKTRNPSRERLQNELAYLRKKVVELERELRVLHVGKRFNSSITGSTITKQGDGEASARVWQRIAQRQARGRDDAEAENRRLKSVLQGQIQLAQKLEQVLHKRPNVSVFRDGEGNSPKKRLCLGAEDPSSMYELFLSELDGLYAQLDGVFHQNGMETSVDDSLRKAYVRTRKGSEDQDELYAELQDVNIIPFHFEKASAAMWCAVKRQYSKNRYHSYQGAMEGLDDTIAVMYHSPCKRRGVNTSLDAIMVMRRYVEKDRLAIVWRSVSRGEDEFSGMYTDETGWSVLKRIPPDSGLNLSGCVMHNCVHIVPKRVEYSAPMPQDEIGLLTNLVIDSYEDDVIALSTLVISDQTSTLWMSHETRALSRKTVGFAASRLATDNSKKTKMLARRESEAFVAKLAGLSYPERCRLINEHRAYLAGERDSDVDLPGPAQPPRPVPPPAMGKSAAYIEALKRKGGGDPDDDPEEFAQDDEEEDFEEDGEEQDEEADEEDETETKKWRGTAKRAAKKQKVMTAA
ncbi:hypothetical protein JG688_00014723 [Phytophthora aleatoria]|uniref:M96 mating-specific protein family n=1 Tax=Phytophthora aleatoria TaxID=2496075 RepID=A0A8J5MDB1_9STRA|nr:hypothetical protein JG688_00014723 [Phytophthora aleatoria]